MKRIMLQMLFVLLSVGLFAQPEKPQTRLSRDTILIGDQIEWIIPLEMAPGEKYFLEDIADNCCIRLNNLVSSDFNAIESLRISLTTIIGNKVIFDSKLYRILYNISILIQISDDFSIFI